MKEFPDAAPPDWATRAAAKAPETPTAPERSTNPLGMVIHALGAGAEAVGRQATHVGKMLVGAEEPESLDDWALQTLAYAPLIALPGVGAEAAATRLGLPALKRILPPLTRIATTGTLEGGRAKMRGASVLPAAMIGAAGAGVVEGGAAGIGLLANRLARPATQYAEAQAGQAARETARAAESTRIGGAMGKALPELATATDAELYGAAHEWGGEQARRVMEPTLNEIRSRIGSTKARWLNLPSVSPDRVSFEEALTAFNISKNRSQIAREMVGELNRLDPQQLAGTLFSQAVKARNATRTYLAIIAKSLDKDGNLDPEKLRTYVNRTSEKLSKYAGEYWPIIREALVGAPSGRVPASILPPRVTLPQAPGAVSRGAAKIGPGLEGGGVQATLDALAGRKPLSEVAIGGAAGLGSLPLRMLPERYRPAPVRELLESMDSD